MRVFGHRDVGAKRRDLVADGVQRNAARAQFGANHDAQIAPDDFAGPIGRRGAIELDEELSRNDALLK
jgi:hypothetical protein